MLFVISLGSFQFTLIFLEEVQAANSTMATESKDPFEYLIRDHRHMSDLFAAYWVAEIAGRWEISKNLAKLMNTHAAIEEMILYPAVSKLTKDGSHMAALSRDQHQDQKGLLDSIERCEEINYLNDLMKELEKDTIEHTTYEESEVFPRLKALLSADEQNNLFDALVSHRRLAPTHAHPYLPDHPPYNMIAGPIVGAVDRARDAIAAKTSHVFHPGPM